MNRALCATMLCAWTTAGSAMAGQYVTLSATVDSRDQQAINFSVKQNTSSELELWCQEQNEGERHFARLSWANEQKAVLRGFKASTRYDCVAYKASNHNVRSSTVGIVLPALPDQLLIPELEVAASSKSQTGFTVLATGNLYYEGDATQGIDLMNLSSDSNYMVILDAEGIVRWYLPGIGAGDIDVTWLGDDRILFGGETPPFSLAPSIVDLTKDFPPEFIAYTRKASDDEIFGLYSHDAGISLEGGSVLTLATTQNATGALGFVIKEVDFNNRLLWYWDAFAEAAAGQDFAGEFSQYYESDPLHCNSLWDVQEAGSHGSVGNYIYMGLRSTSQVLKLNRDTKNIEWRLGYGGDFTLLEADGRPAADSRWFFNPHDAKLVGNLLTVHDNGHDRNLVGGTSYSRILDLKVDQVAMTATIVYEWTEPGWNNPFWGGYDKLDNGHRLIAQGHAGFWPDSLGSSGLIELDENSKVVWRVRYPNEASMLYRADRIDGCAVFNNVDYCPELPSM